MENQGKNEDWSKIKEVAEWASNALRCNHELRRVFPKTKTFLDMVNADVTDDGLNAEDVGIRVYCAVVAIASFYYVAVGHENLMTTMVKQHELGMITDGKIMPIIKYVENAIADLQRPLGDTSQFVDMLANADRSLEIFRHDHIESKILELSSLKIRYMCSQWLSGAAGVVNAGLVMMALGSSLGKNYLSLDIRLNTLPLTAVTMASILACYGAYHFRCKRQTVCQWLSCAVGVINFGLAMMAVGSWSEFHMNSLPLTLVGMASMMCFYGAYHFALKKQRHEQTFSLLNDTRLKLVEAEKVLRKAHTELKSMLTIYSQYTLPYVIRMLESLSIDSVLFIYQS